MQALQPYVTSGVALVSAGLVAVTPVVSPPVSPQGRAIQLTADGTSAPYAELFTNTVDNLENIVQGADPQAIAEAFNAILTDPLQVISVLTDLSPDISTDLSELPAQVSVELPSALAIGIAGLGAFATTLSEIHDVVAELMSGDSQDALSTLIAAPAEILDAYLNGQDGITLLDGLINIPAFNGVLAPEEPLGLDLNLTNLLNALGLADLDLSDLDLSNLLDSIGLGNLDLGTLFDDLNLSDLGLGDLLAGDDGILTLSNVLDTFGLGGLDLGSFSLTDLLSDLGLDNAVFDLSLTDVLENLGLNIDLGSLSLADVLDPLGLNETLGQLDLTDVIDSLFPGLDVGDVSVGGLLDALGLGSIQLGDLLDSLGLLDGVLDTLNGLLSNILDPLGLGDLQDALNDISLSELLSGVLLGDGSGGSLGLTQLLDALGLGDVVSDDSFTIVGLVDALLGGALPETGDLTLADLITDLLGGLGIDIPSTGDLTVSELLTDLLGEFGLPSTDDLTLGGLVDSLNIFDLDVTDLLNTVDLGGLLDTLGLSDLDLNVGDLVGDLASLDLAGLLDDLGLSGDLASITIEPFGGLITELVDDLPQQIAEAIAG